MALFTSITDGIFPTLSDLDAVNLIGRLFESELKWLKNATATAELNNSSPVGALGSNHLTPSYALYGFEYLEVNRTLVSMLAV
jgi:hypothetical protein